MDDLIAHNSLELEVTDFGPIVDAKVDLRPLTVFVGPSNTGKSYLAILIYALHRYFGKTTFVDQYHHQVERMLHAYPPQKLGRQEINAIIEWAQQTILANESTTGEREMVLSTCVSDMVRSMFNAQGGQLGNEIGRCFGIDRVGALIRRSKSKDALIVFRERGKDGIARFEQRLTLSPQASEIRAVMPDRTSVRVSPRRANDFRSYFALTLGEAASLNRLKNENSEFVVWNLMEILVDLVLPRVTGPLHLPAFYLPADRTGVMHSHQVVVSALVQNATTAGLRPDAGTPMLSGVLADFLQQLIELDRPPYRSRRPRRDLGTQIEEAILGGSVRVERSETIDYPYFTYKPEGWKNPLPLMNASSMVSELAPVVLYLRYMVHPGSVLIIEEPESHLHPAMQVEFTRQIAALVQAGVRVIVTTHSEWVLEELANIVRRSELPAARRKEMPRGEFALRPDQVGAWLFKPKRRPRGSVVKEVRLDDSGLYPSEFDEIARVLHNDWAEISSRIGEAE